MKLKLPCTQKMVYLALCDYANKDTGECYPSYRSIAGKAGVSKRTAIRIIEQLLKFGLIERKWRNDDGKNTSNTYRIIDLE